MNVRVLLPMLSGIIALLIARRNELGAIATFASMLGGMIVGWGLQVVIRRMMS